MRCLVGLASRRAVTLLELLVVIFIMALIAGFSTVTFGNFNKNLRYDVAARNVATALRLAKSYAASTGIEHSLNVETDAVNRPEKAFKEYRIEEKKNPPPSEIVDGKRYMLPGDVRFSTSTASEIIVFTPPAGNPASERYIYLVDKDGNTKKTVTVEVATGRIIVQ